MSTIQNNYRLLIRKLDQFIRKYYFNKLIRGFLYTIGLVLVSFILINVLEYFFYFSTDVRKGLFYGFLGLSGLAALIGVLIPLLQIIKLGSVISHKQAAAIIGTHFNNIQDKLLNILQLKEQANSMADASLIEASINQKIETIKPVPFTTAIQLSKNRKYIKYALLPILCLVVILFAAPNLITESTERLINNDKVYEREAPFHFRLVTNDLEVIQHEDLTIEVALDGTAFPQDAFVHFNNFPYKLTKETPQKWTYKFKQLQKDFTFYLEADGIQSEAFTVKVVPRPAMLSFDAKLDYPNYIGKPDETMRNSGDMVIPAGTRVTWGFEAAHTDNVDIKFGKKGKRKSVQRNGEQLFTYESKFSKDATYTVYIGSEKVPNADSVSYGISVIPDLFPNISAEEMRDTLDNMYLYFLGKASDDYGIRKLLFKYKVENNEGLLVGNNGVNGSDYQQMELELGPNPKATNFTHTLDLTLLGLQAGDRATYFFEVWDNDGVNGSKSARTSTMVYELPTVEALEEKLEEKNEEFKKDVQEVLEDVKELKQDAKEMKDNLVQKKDLNWEDRQKLEELVKQHKTLEQEIEQMQEQFKENMEQQDELEEFSEELKEKQKKLEEMFEELMTDEMKELFEKLEELLEEMNKEEIMEELEDFEMSEEQLEEELDRWLELMKQLEFEQQMEETIEDLEKLAEEQEELSKETEQKQDGSDMHQQEKKQEKLNEKFEDIKKEMEKLDEMREELGHKQDIQEETKEQQEQISDDQQQSSEKMDQKKAQEASQKQKDAAKKMQEMAQSMESMKMKMQEDQMEEDMQAIRQLLENLIKLSFDQEDVMDAIEAADINTPQFIELVQYQHKLKDDSELIEDSLIALSKRVFQLEAFITHELKEMNRNIEHSLDHLEERKVGNANSNQQFVMTSINNLALMLDETMQQMQQQMAQQMDGDCNCKKPGKPGSGKCNKPGGLGKMQQQLNDQIKKMQQGLKMGKMPGKGQMSKEIAQMAAQQAAIRQAMQEMAKEQQRGKDGKKKGQGDGSGDELQELAKEMEETETQLVNKQITAEMLKRQQDILSRLLQAEEAQRQQELDKKRKADRPKVVQRSTPPPIEEYLKKKEAEIELYKTVPPALRPHYKSMVEQYFKSISF